MRPEDLRFVIADLPADALDGRFELLAGGTAGVFKARHFCRESRGVENGGVVPRQHVIHAVGPRDGDSRRYRHPANHCDSSSATERDASLSRMAESLTTRLD